MAIEVICPNGHKIQVKDKYAGKSGLCPRCRARIEVPNLVQEEEEELIDLVPRRTAIDEDPLATLPPGIGTGHIDDDDLDEASDANLNSGQSAGESLLSSSIIRHQKMCPKCYQMAPIWYARCTHCDHFFRE